MQLRSGKVLGSESESDAVKIASTIGTYPVGSWDWFHDSMKKCLDITNKKTVNTEEKIERFQVMVELYNMINTHIENVLVEKQFSFSIIRLFSNTKTKAYDLRCDIDLSISNYNTMIENGDKDYIKVKDILINLKAVLESCYIKLCHLSDKHKLSQKLVEMTRKCNGQCISYLPNIVMCKTSECKRI